MNIRNGFIFKALILCMNSHKSYCLKNQFIIDCLFYDTPAYSYDIITFVCSDHFEPIQYFEPDAEIKCSNLTEYRLQEVGSIYFQDCEMSRIKYDIFNAFKDFHTLNIESIKLQYLPEKFFEGANFLERLLASNNRLTEIVPSQITHAPNLTKADFSYNKIENISESAFRGAKSLQILNISHNYIESLHQNTFNDSTNLKVLDLSFNNIKNVENEIFTNLTSLEVLSLANNKLTAFPPGLLPQQMKLNIVNLSNNNLLVIDLKVFGNSKNLETLDLSHNKLKKVFFDTVDQRLAHLETLRLNNNQLNNLTGFKHSMMPSLNSFSLYGNPFNCSYLETFLSNFDSSILDNSETSIDIDNNIHGVNCVRNRTVVFDHTEQNMRDNAPDIGYNKPHGKINDWSNSLIIFLCVLSIMSIVSIFGIFLWARKLMLKMSNNINHTCTYKNNQILNEKSPATTENDYEAVLNDNQGYSTLNFDN